MPRVVVYPLRDQRAIEAFRPCVTLNEGARQAVVCTLRGRMLKAGKVVSVPLHLLRQMITKKHVIRELRLNLTI